jgi:hypothetical protein
VVSSNGTKAIVLREVASFSGRPDVYQIRLHASGVLSCSCPSWRFAKKEERPFACKHMRAAGFPAIFQVVLA